MNATHLQYKSMLKKLPTTSSQTIAHLLSVCLQARRSVGLNRLAFFLFSILYILSSTPTASALTSINTSSSINLKNGLVGHWTFDGKNMTNATATDMSGNGRHGTLTNMTQASSKATGKVGQGLSFDGTNDYVSIPYTGIDFDRTQPITISAWVKLNDVAPAGGVHTIFGRLILSNKGTFFGWCKNALASQCTANSFMLYMGGVTTGLVVSSPTGSGSPGVWTHVVLTYSGNSNASGVKIYKNGTSLTLTTHTNTLSTSITGTTNWRIGDDGTSDYASGVIDDVRFYNRELSAQEVQALYKAGGGTVTNTPPGKSSTGTNSVGLNSGLVGYWTFDGKNMTNATATDLSGNDNNGTLTSMTQADSKTSGKLGQALSFDGTSKYINYGAPSSLDLRGNITISTWVKLNELNRTQGVVSLGISSGCCDTENQLFYSWNNGAAQFSVGFINDASGGPAVYGYTNLTRAGVWYHIVGSWDGTTRSIYVNGNLVATSSQVTPPASVGDRFYVGRAFSGAYLNGSIDDLRIYNRALSASEIRSLYKLGQTSETINPSNTNFTGINSGLVGYWTFDGKNMTSTTALDISGNNRTGTLTNMTQASSKAIGRLGQGLNFDGTNDYLSIPYTGIDYERTQPITISVWVKLNNVAPAGGVQTIFGRLFGAGPSTGTFLGWCKNAVTGVCNANSFSFYIANNYTADGVIASSATNSALPGVWTHVVATYSGNSNVSGVKIYKNGVSQSLTTHANNLTSSVTGTTNWRIGDDTTSDYSSGIIDDVRFYNRELSATEVKKLYKLGTQ